MQEFGRPYPALFRGNAVLWTAALVLAFFLAGHTPAMAASAQAEYKEGWNEYRSLARDAKRAKYRDNWQKVEAKFQKAYKLAPKGPTAPKSLYFIGRIYNEVGSISALKKDNRKSVEYFTKVIDKWPLHGWTDDCLWYRGTVKLRMGDRDGAHQDFSAILDRYSRSDMAPKARKSLAAMAKAGYSAPQSEPKSEPEPAPAKSAPEKPRTPRPVYAVSGSNAAQLTGIRFTSGEEYTRVTLDLDHKAKYVYQQLNPIPAKKIPHRLYFDLDSTSVDRGVDPDITVADGNLRRIRSSQNNPTTTRVVLDFLEMQEYKIFALENPFRIVVDVFAPKNKPAGGGSAKQSAPASRETSATAAFSGAKPDKSMAGDLLEQLGLTVHTVMIDPGHGGKDPGARANGLTEKDINLRFAKILGKKLREKGFNVEYTRTTDTFVPLEDRTAMANMKKADLFISVHCNANKISSVNGLETYSLNLASSKHAVQVAARENALEPKHISDLQIILTDLMLSSKLKESKDLAGRVQEGAVQHARKRYSLKDHGVREAPFYVLMGAKMPSVLLELGYLTNRTEAKRLATDQYLDQLADGVVKGVLAYKSQIERFASI